MPTVDAAKFARQLVSADRAGQDKINNTAISQKKAQLQAYEKLDASMKTMSDKLKGFDSDAFNAKSGTISNEAAKVTVRGSVPSGNYNLVVSKLAQTHQLTKAYGAADSKIPTTGVLSIQVGTDVKERMEIDFAAVNPSGEGTVTELRDYINRNSGDLGVQAALVRTGGTVELMISSIDTGAANQLTVELDGKDWGMTERRAAQDAELTLSGIAITSSSNTIENVIDGMDLELDSVHTGTESSLIKVKKDTETSKQVVKDFVDSVNTLLSEINQLTRPMSIATEGDSADKAKVKESQIGILKGDTSVRFIQSRIRDVMFKQAPNGMRISDIGVEFDRNGKLTIDDKKLSKALASNSDQVAKFFTQKGSYVDPKNPPAVAPDPKNAVSFIDSIGAILKPFTGTTGLISNKKTNLNQGISRVEANAERHNRMMEQKYQMYLAQFNALNKTITQLDSVSAMFAVPAPQQNQ